MNVGISRRGAVLALGMSAAARAWAQSKYPSKPVRIIVPFVVGSQVDYVAREIGRRLQESLGSRSSSTTGRALIDTVAGRSALYWAPVGLTLPFIRDGRLQVLAVSTAVRAPLMPDVPAISLIYDHWYGMVAPAKTPKAVVDQLAREIERFRGRQKLSRARPTWGWWLRR